MPVSQDNTAGNSSKDALIGLLLHDLRPALHSLKFLASSFSSSSHEMDQQKLLAYGKELNAAVEDLMQSTAAIFTWMEVQRQKFQPRFQPVLAATVLHEARTYFRKEAPYYKVKIECKAPDDLQVHTDNEALGIILHQLLRNAAAQKNDGTILLEAWQQDSSTYISVSDAGKGMSSRVAENIQAHLIDESTTSVLYRYGYRIIIRVLQLLGSSIRFEKAALGGAKVIIIIPNQRGSQISRPEDNCNGI